MDFNKELEGFNFFEVDADLENYTNETVCYLDAFNRTLKKIGKEQNSANLLLDELNEKLEENSGRTAIESDLRNRLEDANRENRLHLENMMAMMDQVEDLYRYSLKHNSAEWASQIKLVWENMKNALALSGISIIDSSGTGFDPQIHTAVLVRVNADIPVEAVLEVLKSGYTAKMQVLRKAKVIINKKEECENE